MCVWGGGGGGRGEQDLCHRQMFIFGVRKIRIAFKTTASSGCFRCYFCSGIREVIVFKLWVIFVVVSAAPRQSNIQKQQKIISRMEVLRLFYVLQY